MRNVLLLLSIFVVSKTLSQEKESIKLLGGKGLDVGNYIIPVSTGGYLAVGYHSSESTNGYVGAITKLDPNQNELWTKTYRELGDNRAWSVAECPNGDFLLAGFSNSFKETQDDDAWIFRVDANGELLWEKNLGGSGNDLAWDIKRLTDGGYVIAAQTESKGAGNMDAWLIKVNEAGEVVWESTYGSAGRERIFSITQGVNGILYATGIFKESKREDPIDVYTIAVNPSNGSLVWEDYFDRGQDDTGHGVVFDKQGGVWVAGYTTSEGNGAQDGFLMRYIDGEVQNFYTYGGTASDRIMTVVHGSSNDLWLIGYSESYGHDFDIWTVRTNASGENLMTKTIERPGFDRGVHMLIEGSKFHVVGTLHDEKNDPDFVIWSEDF